MSKQVQYVAAAVISVIVIFYVLALVVGFIPERGRIDFSTLLLILITIGAVVALLYPTAMSTFGDILGRVTTVEIASMKFALADIRAKQIDQSATIDTLRLIMPLVLSAPERNHLRNLYHGMTENYKGNHQLRVELRRLRYLDLIKNPQQPIGSATDGRVFNLTELVELTSLGREWAKQIDNMDRSANAPEVQISGE